jgi:DNA-binding FadR family transcriptional regulator
MVALESGLVERVMPAHIELLKSVELRDAKSAQQTMRAHLLAALEVQKRAALSASKQRRR